MRNVLFNPRGFFEHFTSAETVCKCSIQGLRCVMAKILFIGAKDISAVRQPNHQDCPLGCDFRLEIKMLRSRLLHRIFSFISDVLSTKSLEFSPVLFLLFQKACVKRVLNILTNIEMHAIIETMIMGTKWKLNIGILDFCIAPCKSLRTYLVRIQQDLGILTTQKVRSFFM